MKLFNSNKTTKKIFLFFIFVNLTRFAFSQSSDSTRTVYHFRGDVNITNNGISLVPLFALGKPAVTFNLSMGNERLSFDPQFYFSTEGKPWSFVFWIRYKLKNTGKFRTNIGTHLGLPFSESPVISNAIAYKTIVSHRFLATEIAPYYLLSKNITVGAYYLYAHGLDENSLKNNHYLALTTSIANIALGKQLLMRFSPQLYYLKLDNDDGFYVFSTLAFTKKDYPISLAFSMNNVIETNISVGKSLDWNATISYSFSNNFVKK